MTPVSQSLLIVHLALLFTAILWGGNFTAMKYLLEQIDPLDVLILRVGGAAILFAIILLTNRRHHRLPTRPDLTKFLALGVLGITIVNIAFVYGQSMIPVTLASLVVTSNPIFTAIIARFLGQESITRRKIAGIALAMTGFLVVLFFGSSGGAGLGGGEVKGMLLIAIGPFSWAFYTVLSKPLLLTYDPLETAGYTAIGGMVGLIPLLVINGGFVGRVGDLGGLGWLSTFYVSALGFFLAYILWYRGLQVLSASQTAVYIYLVPVFGLVFAWLLLDEAVTRFLLFGAAMILAGVVLTNSARIGSSPRTVSASPIKPQQTTG